MRATSHTQNNEPPLEYFLSEWRFRKAIKYIPKNSVVADLGCGYNGNLLKRISDRIKLGIGYDVTVAKTGLPKNIALTKTDLNGRISHRKNYFDVITALAVLEHVEDPEAFFRKIKIMLKRGGKVIVTTPHKRAKPLLEFLSFRLGLISKEEIKDHKNYFDEKTIKHLFKKIGLKNITVRTFEMGVNIFAVAQKI